MASTKLTEGEAWVERIMGQKRKGKNMLFRIKWEKDPTTTWEPFENVQSADAHIDDYLDNGRNQSLVEWLAGVGYNVNIKSTEPKPGLSYAQQ
ncbi:hypothetical protein LTR09_012582 [Extremus antarcticus]|uniref:Chromo domain-containing protein n=1 Tax=Extremus antarcticus TaxID=702011 RepID=A0AAJ0D9M2_9PEZI|nr:hypothetical protein LTR09_012582 [Extremus antarcticus]